MMLSSFQCQDFNNQDTRFFSVAMDTISTSNASQPWYDCVPRKFFADAARTLSIEAKELFAASDANTDEVFRERWAGNIIKATVKKAMSLTPTSKVPEDITKKTELKTLKKTPWVMDRQKNLIGDNKKGPQQGFIPLLHNEGFGQVLVGTSHLYEGKAVFLISEPLLPNETRQTTRWHFYDYTPNEEEQKRLQTTTFDDDVDEEESSDGESSHPTLRALRCRCLLSSLPVSLTASSLMRFGWSDFIIPNSQLPEIVNLLSPDGINEKDPEHCDWVEFQLAWDTHKSYKFQSGVVPTTEGENIEWDNYDPMGRGGSYKHPWLDYFLKSKSAPRKPTKALVGNDIDDDKTYQVGATVFYKSLLSPEPRRGRVQSLHPANDEDDAPTLYDIVFDDNSLEHNVKADDLKPDDVSSILSPASGTTTSLENDEDYIRKQKKRGLDNELARQLLLSEDLKTKSHDELIKEVMYWERQFLEARLEAAEVNDHKMRERHTYKQVVTKFENKGEDLLAHLAPLYNKQQVAADSDVIELDTSELTEYEEDVAEDVDGQLDARRFVKDARYQQTSSEFERKFDELSKDPDYTPQTETASKKNKKEAAAGEVLDKDTKNWLRDTAQWSDIERSIQEGLETLGAHFDECARFDKWDDKGVDGKSLTVEKLLTSEAYEILQFLQNTKKEFGMELNKVRGPEGRPKDGKLGRAQSFAEQHIFEINVRDATLQQMALHLDVYAQQHCQKDDKRPFEKLAYSILKVSNLVTSVVTMVDDIYNGLAKDFEEPHLPSLDDFTIGQVTDLRVIGEAGKISYNFMDEKRNPMTLNKFLKEHIKLIGDYLETSASQEMLQLKLDRMLEIDKHSFELLQKMKLKMPFEQKS